MNPLLIVGPAIAATLQGPADTEPPTPSFGATGCFRSPSSGPSPASVSIPACAVATSIESPKTPRTAFNSTSWLGTVLANERPQDEGENTRGTVYAGLAWDSRDNDCNPKDGSLHDVSVGFDGPWASGETMWQRANVSFRHYHSLGTPQLVLARQVLGEHVFGDAPLMPLSEFSGIRLRSGVGGLETGRVMSADHAF